MIIAWSGCAEKSSRYITDVATGCRVIPWFGMGPTKFRFDALARVCLSGVSSSGKTEFVKKLVDNKHLLFANEPDRVVFVYKYEQPFFRNYPNVEFTQDIPNDLAPERTSLVIFDDILESAALKEIAALFARGRHLGANLVYITQNLFQQNADFRMISLNCSHFVFFNSIRNYHQGETFARQTFGREDGKLMLQAYKDCTSRPYGYLLIDLTTGQTERFRTNVFPNEEEIVYTA
jgi:hypothetical protein